MTGRNPEHPTDDEQGLGTIRRLSDFLTRSTLPIVAGLFIMGLVLTYLQLSRNQDILVERTAIQHAQVYAHILDRVRELYASEVVETAKASGLEVTHDYRKHENAIPLPITLSRELEHKLGPAETGTTAKVYSPFPFEWREKFGGLPDQFAEDAWQAFEDNPKREDFYTIEPYRGVLSLRYAVPQIMQTACVECHNTYDGSPKEDWKVDDVRGVVEVVYPLEQAEALARNSIWETFGILSPMLLLALIMLTLTLGQHRRWNRSLEARVVAEQKAQQALKMSESRYRTVLETTPDFNMIVSADGTIEFINRAGQIYDDSQIGTNLLDYLEADVATEIRAALDRALVSGDLITVEFRQESDDGSTHYFSTRIQKLADGEGRLLVVSTDVTEKKRLETQARQAQRMQAVGRLAGGVAHDFNNLLTAIVSFASFAMESSEPDSPAYDDLKQVLRAAGRGEELTKQLLAFSKHNKGSSKVIEVNNAIAGVEEMLDRLIGADIQFVVQPGENLKNVRIDSAALDQVVVNLALNARDAMPNGGRLEIATAPLSLSQAAAEAVGLKTDGDFVRITLSDNGTGMDADTMRHMFDPFFTTKGAGKGTGLGLATCWGIVQRAGGQIDVLSEPGHGTTMHVYLPGVDDEVSDEAQRPENLVLTGTETIVVAEDNESVRDSVVRALKGFGYRVIEAGDGQDALDICGISPPGTIDLLLTDVVMPLMNGTELAQKVLAIHPDIRLLYMSGYTDDTALEDGVHGVQLLQKPFAPEVLARKVREVLDNIRETQGGDHAENPSS